MIVFIARRVFFMAVTMFVVSLLVFLLLEVNGQAVAIRVLGPYTSEEQRQLWLEANGYLRPAYVRFGEWIVNVLQGDFGESIRFKAPVSDILWDRLKNTAILGGLVFAIMVPLGVILGVMAGVSEGSWRDRVVTLFSVLTTSVPEFASAVFLSVIFVFTLKWLPGTSSMVGGFQWSQIVLPVAVLVIYAFGYVARMMRASMAEVMQSAYIRTATLKGLPYRRIIFSHALRNALIAPFTVIILQINWLLSGVIVVESFFAYKGFGALLLEGALNQDVYLVQAAALVSVFVAVLTQVISDIGYAYLNPRIRFT